MVAPNDQKFNMILETGCGQPQSGLGRDLWAGRKAGKSRMYFLMLLKGQEMVRRRKSGLEDVALSGIQTAQSDLDHRA